jgi:RNA polymerase sigma-70 factor (ECF subfamily)
MRRVGRAATPDIVADTFAIAFRHATSPREPLPWLYAIARNLVRNHARAAARRPVAVPAYPMQDVADVVADRDLVVRALQTLPELSREALMLTAWEGLVPAEAAQVIGISPAAFRVRLHRARRQLETELGSSTLIEKGP